MSGIFGTTQENDYFISCITTHHLHAQHAHELKFLEFTDFEPSEQYAIFVTLCQKIVTRNKMETEK